ncbi:MAG: hypothetical protein IPJ60_14035 [Sphingobacteriaceae bacterium]|nr:hypothetical protein [Sphingobacteriaceae bacterium]
MKQLLFFTAICFASISNATIWNVGPSQTYTVPSQVRLLVQDGDTIRIDGGVYANDVAKWVKRI